MEYWIIVNEQPQGPFTLEQLAQRRITPDTKVWRTGLSDWVEAEALEELDAVLNQPQAFTPEGDDTPDVPPPTMGYNNTAGWGGQPGSPVQSAATVMPKQPPTYLGWNVAMLICCCTIGGIIGLVFSLLSSSRYRQGRYDLARRWSRRAEMMVIISFTLGCVSWPFSMLFQVLLNA